LKLWLGWLVAHAIAGAIAGALENGGFQFSATLIFKGALTGIAQWLVLRRYLQQMRWWAIATSMGWVTGQFLKIILLNLLPMLQGRPFNGMIPAAFMAIAQVLVFPQSFTPAIVWIGANTVGGILDALVSTTVNRWIWSPLTHLFPGDITVILTAALIEGCGWVIYGVVTGIALTWLWKRQTALEVS
jgi:hypothetical protein